MAKMIKYTNGFGCIMEFEETIPLEQINQRLSLFGSNWKKLDDNLEIKENK